MAEQKSTSWVDTAIQAVQTIASQYYQGEAAKETAKVQASIEKSQIDANNTQKIQTNIVKNVLLVVGGTLGVLLVYKVAKNILK